MGFNFRPRGIKSAPAAPLLSAEKGRGSSFAAKKRRRPAKGKRRSRLQHLFAHRLAAEDVDVQVMHRLPCVLPLVDDEAVAVCKA